MKKIIKTFAVLAAVAALSFGVTSCSSDSSDSNSLIPAPLPNNTQNTTTTNTSKTDTTNTTTSSTTASGATFKGKVMGFDTELSFAADGTYLIKMAGENNEKGTYTLTGDFNNGTIAMKQTHSWKNKEWKEKSGSENFKIENGVGTSVDYGFTLTKTETTTAKTDASKTDATKPDTSKTDTAKTDAAQTDNSKTDTTKTATAKTDTTKTDTPKTDNAATGTETNNNGNSSASSDTTAANGSVTFAATIFGSKVSVTFTNGTYEQYKDGELDGKGTYTMTGDFNNGTMRLVETEQRKKGKWQTLPTAEIIDCTITDGKLTNKYGSYYRVNGSSGNSGNSSTGSGSDTTAANGSATFAATIWINYVSVTFTNGNYEQYKDGKLDGKGTYTMTGDFNNGTMRLVETEQRKKGIWQRLSEPEIIECTITNGELKNKYGSYYRVNGSTGNAGNAGTTTTTPAASRAELSKLRQNNS